MSWLNKVLCELSLKQEKIDEYIKIKNNINLNSDEILNKKIIALFTEISEFINELRCFKYWSKKKESERNIILEEYIDCIHFLLSIGNNIKFNWNDYKYNRIIDKNVDINKIAFFSYIELASFAKNINKINFTKFLDVFFCFIEKKQITSKELYDAYMLKNQINYKRQTTYY